jgi:hypothetical protein
MSEEFSSEFASLLAQANKVLKEAGEALNLAVEGMSSAGSFRQIYIHQQAMSVASVALDVHLLVSHQRFQNVVGLCRIGFESRISVYAAMRVPEFAAQKYLATAKGHAEKLEELIKDGATEPHFQSELDHYQRLLADMRLELGGVEEKNWRQFKDVAKSAGLLKDYEAHYATLSMATHNTPTGLASKDDCRILVACVLNLLLDAIEACAALVFFPIPGQKSPMPLTKHWDELTDPIIAFQTEYGNLKKKLNDLTHETLRHPET